MPSTPGRIAWLVLPALASLLLPVGSARALSAGDVVGIELRVGGFRVHQLDPDAGTAAPLGSEQSGSYQRLAIEPDGQVLVAGFDGVQRLDPGTGAFTPLSSEPVEAIDVAADGRVYVVDGGTFYEFAADSGLRTPILSVPERVSGVAATVPGKLITLREVPDDPGSFDEVWEVVSIDLATSATSVLSAFTVESYFYGLDVEATPGGDVFALFSSSEDEAFVASTAPDTPSFAGNEEWEPSAFVIDDDGSLIVQTLDAGLFRVSRVGGVDVEEVLAEWEGFYLIDLERVPVPEPGAITLIGFGLALALRTRAPGSGLA